VWMRSMGRMGGSNVTEGKARASIYSLLCGINGEEKFMVGKPWETELGWRELG
jgi:hypothetical protein